MADVAIASVLDELRRNGRLRVIRPRHPKAPPTRAPVVGIEIMEGLLGVTMPDGLKELYRAGVERIGGRPFINPASQGYEFHLEEMKPEVLQAGVIPIFMDTGACYFGLDVTGADTEPGVYFFDHGGSMTSPDWAVASSLSLPRR
jgi:hypothetical protein